MLGAFGSRSMPTWVRALTLGALVVIMTLGTAAPARAETFAFSPSSASPGASVQVNISGTWVDTWFPKSGISFQLHEIPNLTIVTGCAKKTNLLNQTRWLHCEFTIPNDTVPGLITLRVYALENGVTLYGGPRVDFDVEPPPPPPTTTIPTTTIPTTAAPTTTTLTTTTLTTTVSSSPKVTADGAEQVTTSLASDATAGSTGSTSITDSAQNQTTTTFDVLVAASATSSGSGGPSWLTVFLVAALAVAITVIVFQNLQRQDRE